MEEKIISAQDKIIKLEAELFTQLKQEVAGYAQQLLYFSKIIGEIDVYLAYANNAVEYNYVCPEVNDGKDLILQDARHPVIERILGFIVKMAKNRKVKKQEKPNKDIQKQS